MSLMTDEKRVEMAHDIVDYLRKSECDYYVYAGEVTRRACSGLASRIQKKVTTRDSARLLISTVGGDPDAAYILARALRQKYSHLTVVVWGICKSAGTLIALAGDTLAFSTLGELGPLDIQVSKTDELMLSESGLNTLQAVDEVQRGVASTFLHAMERITNQFANGSLSAKLLTSIAQHLAVETWRHIATQIDPYRLADVRRSMNIASAYAARLTLDGRSNMKPGTLDALINNYPSHTFVIDMKEAGELFTEVELATTEDIMVATMLVEHVSKPHGSARGIDAGAHMEAILSKLEGKLRVEEENQNAENIGAPQKGEARHDTGPEERDNQVAEGVPPAATSSQADDRNDTSPTSPGPSSGAGSGSVDSGLGRTGPTATEDIREEKLTNPPSQ